MQVLIFQSVNAMHKFIYLKRGLRSFKTMCLVVNVVMTFIQMLEEEDRGRAGLYSMDDLVSQVQASHGQIKAALKSMQAVEIEGFWRVVDEKFMQGLLEVILLSAVQHDWNLKSLSEPQVVETIRNDGYSPESSNIVLPVTEKRWIRTHRNRT